MRSAESCTDGIEARERLNTRTHTHTPAIVKRRPLFALLFFFLLLNLLLLFKVHATRRDYGTRKRRTAGNGTHHQHLSISSSSNAMQWRWRLLYFIPFAPSRPHVFLLQYIIITAKMEPQSLIALSLSLFRVVRAAIFSLRINNP